MLELQSGFARAFGNCLDAAMITVTRPVEDHLAHSRGFGLLRQGFADSLALAHLAGAIALHAFAQVAHAEDADPAVVIDQLGIDVLQRTEHDEAGTPGRAGNLLPHPQVAAVTQLLPRGRRLDRAHDYFAPVLPALRRTCSPWYRMPLPLYGSGGRMLRSSAATWPTISLSAPSIFTTVLFSTANLIPAGALYCTGWEKPRLNWRPKGLVSAL